MSVEYFDEQRRQLIAAIRAHTEQVATEIGKTALDKRVLRAMTKVPRHEFVPAEVQPYAYANRPLPIGFGKTISQPFMVPSSSENSTGTDPSSPNLNSPEETRLQIQETRRAELVADENFADRRLHRAHFGVVGIVFMVGRQRADFIRGSFRIGA